MSGEAQASGTVLMVRPCSFAFHPEAAQSNVFASATKADVATAASEFEAAAKRLSDAGIEVLMLDDTPDPPKPDAVFPNNWVSFHAEGTIVLYPMATAGRWLERNVDRLKALLEANGFRINRIIDLSFHERTGHFLEGTGSLVLDRPARRAFAAPGPRTDASVVADFDDRLGYSTLLFDSRDRTGRPIYHTNVLMSLGTKFAVLCTDAVEPEFQDLLKGEIEAGGRTIIEVDYEQMRQFACNLIELKGRRGPVIALSSAAGNSFGPDQLRMLENFGELVQTDIPTIESVGGGSLRCMIADIHLPRST